MKIKGLDLTKEHVDFVVFTRGDQKIVFTIKGVYNYDEFDTLVELPKPNIITNVKTGQKTADTESPSWTAKITEYVQLKNAYTALKSLSATEGLEWETVDIGQPDTWLNIDKELRQVFSENELNFLLSKIVEVNGNAETLNKARESFLAEKSQEKNM